MYKAGLKAPDRAGSRHFPLNAQHEAWHLSKRLFKLFRLEFFCYKNTVIRLSESNEYKLMGFYNDPKVDHRLQLKMVVLIDRIHIVCCFCSSCSQMQLCVMHKKL